VKRRASPATKFPLWESAVLLLVVLFGAIWFLSAERDIAGQRGFPLDDSWIYATFARNLATGHGYSFNPGESIAGATGPLYVFILALFYLMFHDVVWPAKVLGILCLGASSLVVHQTARRILPGRRLAPFLAGLLVALSPTLLWGSLTGLELPVYLLLACLGANLYVREKWTLAVLFWAIGVWLRPDGLFLVVLGLVLRPKISLRNSVAPLIAAAAIVGVYFGFNELVGGQILPSSVGVKAHAGLNLGASEWVMLKHWADLWGLSDKGRVGLHAPILLAGMIGGAWLSLRRWPAMVAYAVLFPFAFAAFGSSPGQFDRYIAYVVPFGVLFGVVGFDHVANRVLRGRALAALLILGAVCVGWEAHAARIAGIGYGWNVQNINGMQRYIAEDAHKATAPGDTIAVNDVGAMGFFSGCYVVDLVGLVSPKREFPENLRVYRPKFMAIFPDWFQKFGRVDRNTGQVVFYDADSTYKYAPFLGVRLKTNTISARNTMYVYKRMRPGEAGASRISIVEQ
jgi:hypothetical protein